MQNNVHYDALMKQDALNKTICNNALVHTCTGSHLLLCRLSLAAMRALTKTGNF